MRTSIFVFVLVIIFVVLLLVIFVVRQNHGNNPTEGSSRGNRNQRADDDGGSARHTKRKYLMLLGILAASVTYQAGLHPPGGVWQSDDDIARHAAGNPVLRDNRKPRYRTFFYSNSISFVASVVVILLLLPESTLLLEVWLLRTMNTTIVLDMIGLLVAYGAGSSREWETSGYVIAMAIVVLGYFAIHAVLSTFGQGQGHKTSSSLQHPQQIAPVLDAESQETGNGRRGTHGSSYIMTPPAGEIDQQPPPWEYTLRKYLLLLASLVATVAYGAGLSPPGGVWDDNAGDHTTGDPIMRDHHLGRYLVFFYCNATAFASSLLVIVLILLFAVLREKRRDMRVTVVMPLRVVMVLDLLSLMGAYAAGTCRDRATTVYTAVLSSAVFLYYVVTQRVLARDSEHDGMKERPRKVILLLATFATSLTYVAGLSTMPGGFWSKDGGSHRAGEAVLAERHPARLTAFLLCNTTAFVASLLIIALLLAGELRDGTTRSWELYGCIVVSMAGLVGAYAAGSTRVEHTTVNVVALVAAVLAYIAFQAIVVPYAVDALRGIAAWRKLARIYSSLSKRRCGLKQHGKEQDQASIEREAELNRAMEKTRSLVLLLATLAATVTFQATLDPPGGYWQANKDGLYKAGDPILLTTKPRRYKAFFYCNSTAFVASLLAIILVQSRSLLKRHALEAAMILDLFGLMSAYATGSCRDVSTSIYVMAIAGAVLVYVVIHVVFFTLDHKGHDEDELLEKRRKRLLLFAILSATITYQAGLTPQSGFWQADDNDGHRAGELVLFSNNPYRYKAFFYCNTTSFMSSIALIILLVNPNLYRPAIQSYALSVCMVAGMFGLMGAYAAGSSQHLSQSIFVFVLVIIFVVLLLVVFMVRQNYGNPIRRHGSSSSNQNQRADDDGGSTRHTKRKYLMLLGILAASVTYQAGLHPPGGVWQGDDDIAGHAAGNPVLRDNRKPRYRTFYYSNSTSFMASVVVILLLLPESTSSLQVLLLRAMDTTILLDMIGLLVAYGAGSSRQWETSGYVIAMAIVVLGYFAIHAMLSTFGQGHKTSANSNNHQITPELDTESQEPGNGRRSAQGSYISANTDYHLLRLPVAPTVPLP
uniref:PGG domain-containing protein n=1 Tax=Leersia perrieri TaxID=77586 RepID=A0A0D9WPF2_9ORYZ